MSRRHTPQPDRESGVVLIISLALIALMAVVVVAYFSRTITNRRVESAASGSARAETLARAASQIILSDIHAEIVAGSTVSQPAPNQMRIYKPTDAQKAVPARVLATGAMATNPNFNSLVKQSTGRFYPATGYSGTPLITSSSGSKTTVVSANNKNVSIARWNAPLLNSGSGFSSVNELPSWILVDRTGIATSQAWSNTFRDYTPGNDRAVIGRFAFNVCDVGGLLDANVAGYPVERLAAGSPGFSSALTDGEMQSLKSTQAGAHLFSGATSIIPAFDRAMQTAFVNTWKFGSAGTSKVNFLADFMTRTIPPSSTVSPTYADSGFMRPTVRNPGSTSSDSNTIAYSRQDLLRLAHASTGYISTAALPYFTHFSRETNAPSWSPTTPAGSTINYETLADQPTAINRNVPNARVQVGFTRADGTAAVQGEPLMKYRFPLRRLDAVGAAGVNTSSVFPVMVNGTLQTPSDQTVRRDFGLAWNAADSRWDYKGSTGTAVQATIATLSDVAAAGREPNFFEILKAFILHGSIGFGSVGQTFVGPEGRYHQQPKSSDLQIIQIGSNIIDQWDADKNPTFILFGPDEIAGVENLPFLNKISFQCRWSTAATPTFSAFLVPSFWTAAQNATAVGTQSTSAPYNIPSVRFVMASGTASAVVESASASAPSNVVTGSAAQPSATLTASARFGGPNTSGNPLPYYPPDAASSATTIKPGMTGTANSKLGVTISFPGTGAVTKANTIRAYPKLDNVTFEMQAQVGGPTGPWKTYQRWSGCTVNLPSPTAVLEPPSGFDWSQFTIHDPEFVLLDPRTMRFGAWQTDAKTTGDASDFTRGVDETLDRSPGGFQKITGMEPQGPQFSGAGAEMASNAATTPGYVDRDGVRRRGDVTGSTASLLAPGNFMDRPPLLSRQTRTVAELGTVFRDQPWKTLNFTTGDSADAGLLDAFTILEPNTVFRSDLTAGKLSLNTRHLPVLRAVLAGIATNTDKSAPMISDAQRDAIAAALTAMTSSQPMLNKSELVTRLASHSSVTSLGNKEAREAVIRALSDVGQTRTWNLMIDVVAQTGRYGSAASNVDSFIVQGEKRYWLHVAIDRFTGEVIDQQLEAVYE
jgi:Tfp pilus assembly protein PilX